MYKRTLAWKRKNPFMTFICFIAYHLGYYKFQIRAVLRFLFISAVIFTIFMGMVYFLDLSIHIHKTGELWFVFPVR